MIEQLETQASSQLAANTDAGYRSSATAIQDGYAVEVSDRRNRSGKDVFRYSYGGIRLERSTLLLLICPEAACEYSQAAQRQWREFQGIPLTRSKSVNEKFQFTHLTEDVPIEGGNGACVARTATFVCLTPCPVNAHKPVRMRKTGWDLFENGKCLAGGLTPNPTNAALEPMFPTISTAQAWLASNLNATPHASAT